MVLGEDDAVRHLVQSAGALPPYADLRRVLPHARRMPEFWRSTTDPPLEIWFRGGVFIPRAACFPDEAGFQGWKAFLSKPSQETLPRLWVESTYHSHRVKGLVSLAEFRARLTDFVERIKRVAQVRHALMDPDLARITGARHH